MLTILPCDQKQSLHRKRLYQHVSDMTDDYRTHTKKQNNHITAMCSLLHFHQGCGVSVGVWILAQGQTQSPNFLKSRSCQKKDSP